MSGLSQRATTNVAVLALLASLAALCMSAYSLWLEPERLKAQLQLAESNREVARATIQLQEWLDAQERRRTK